MGPNSPSLGPIFSKAEDFAKTVRIYKPLILRGYSGREIRTFRYCACLPRGARSESMVDFVDGFRVPVRRVSSQPQADLKMMTTIKFAPVAAAVRRSSATRLAVRSTAAVVSEETLDLLVLGEHFKLHRRSLAFRHLLRQRLPNAFRRCLLGEPPKTDRLPEMPAVPHFEFF